MNLSLYHCTTGIPLQPFSKLSKGIVLGSDGFPSSLKGQTTQMKLGGDPNNIHTNTKLNEAEVGAGLCFAPKWLCFGSDIKDISGHCGHQSTNTRKVKGCRVAFCIQEEASPKYEVILSPLTLHLSTHLSTLSLPGPDRAGLGFLCPGIQTGN